MGRDPPRRLPELRQRGLRWQGLGRDGLMGEGPGLCVVLNRSRTNSLNLVASVPGGQTIGGELSDTLLVGVPAALSSELAPQSALLFSQAAA